MNLLTPAAKRARVARYQRTDAGKATQRKAQKTYRANGGASKQAARLRLTRARARGTIQQLTCELCDDPNTQAHHPFGYEGDLALAVWWLCRPHHYALHAFLRRAH